MERGLLVNESSRDLSQVRWMTFSLGGGSCWRNPKSSADELNCRGGFGVGDYLASPELAPPFLFVLFFFGVPLFSTKAKQREIMFFAGAPFSRFGVLSE